MAAWDNLVVGVRRLTALVLRVWVVAILGLAATAALTTGVARAPGVYFGSADVVLLAPPSDRSPNTLGVVSGSLIATAGLIQREVSGGPDASHVVSDDVSLVDEGVTSGVAVTLPNSGGQWANNFDKPVLHVQSVDPDPRVALAQLNAAVAAIQHTVTRRQDEAGVAPDHRIRTDVTPFLPSVDHYTGMRSRSLAGAVALGLGLTFGLMVLVDGWRRDGGFASHLASQVVSSHRRRRIRPQST